MKDWDMVARKLEQLSALTYAMLTEAENTAEFIEEETELEAVDRLQNLIYLMLDELDQVKAAVHEANGHLRVCNALQQAAYMRNLEQENAELKQFISENIGEVLQHGET